MKRLMLSFSVLLLAATAVSATVAPDLVEYARRFEQFPASRGQGSESERLRKLFDLSWEYVMHSSPEFATYVGYPGLNDRWSDASPESLELRPRHQPQDPGGPRIDRPLEAHAGRAGQLRPGSPPRRAGDRRGEVPRRVPADQPGGRPAAEHPAGPRRHAGQQRRGLREHHRPAEAAFPRSSTRRSPCSTRGSRRGSRRRGSRCATSPPRWAACWWTTP